MDPRDNPDIPDYDALFAFPSLETLVSGLTWQQFQDFINYVFTCAGYRVEAVHGRRFPDGPGVDFNLYGGHDKSTLVSRAEVRHFHPQNPIQLNAVAAFDGFLHQRQNQHIPGYMVTTSSFMPNAKIFADNSDLTRLMDGKKLLRYIAYVGGSRVTGEYADEPVDPPYPTEPDYLRQADELMTETAPRTRKTRILTVANGKGGVAKTTTALNVAFALADQHKQRVLLIDLDGQASATRTLPPQAAEILKDVEPPRDTAFISDYFRGKVTLKSLIRRTRFSNLYLVPAQLELQRIDSGGLARPRAELTLVRDLRNLSLPEDNGDSEEPFDWIIIDTPPAQSFYARSAIAAADYVLISAFAETYALLGLNAVLATIQTMGALTGELPQWKDRIIGCVVCRWKPSVTATASLGTLETELAAKHITRLRNFIPTDDRIEQAHQSTVQGGLRSIFKLARNPGPAAKAYDNLTEEVLEYVNRYEEAANAG